jgi:hypothetical protein
MVLNADYLIHYAGDQSFNFPFLHKYNRLFSNSQIYGNDLLVFRRSVVF